MGKRTKAESKKTKRKSIPRQTRRFQLRTNHPIDSHVEEILNFKRSQRAEVTAIRDGVRLLWALENNDLSVLFEMFPHLKSQFIAPAGGDGGPLDEIRGMLEMIAAQQKTGNGYLMQSSSGQGTGKQLNAPQFALPIFEMDDEPTVIIKASTNTDSSLNFVSALKSLAQ